MEKKDVKDVGGLYHEKGYSYYTQGSKAKYRYKKDGELHIPNGYGGERVIKFAKDTLPVRTEDGRFHEVDLSKAAYEDGVRLDDQKRLNFSVNVLNELTNGNLQVLCSSDSRPAYLEPGTVSSYTAEPFLSKPVGLNDLIDSKDDEYIGF